MSGPPARFAPERATSPLDQKPPNPFPSGQPPSFKTNVNRNKTRKWVEAKPFSYDGDDWGDYDEDDEYGVASHQSAAPQAPTGLRQRGQSIGKDVSRSFTDPQPGGAPASARRNSFEYGEEKRAFSSAATMPVQPSPIDTSGRRGNGPAPGAPVLQPAAMVNSPTLYSPSQGSSSQQPAQPLPPGRSQTQTSDSPHREPMSAQSRESSTSWAPSVVSDSSASMDPQHRRDFSQSALPPPLQMRSSPAPPGTPDANTPNTRFPPRKSSLGQADQPPPLLPQAGEPSESTPTASRQRAPSNPNKPLPFVRPADIYKRLENERQRERASMDSERPSLDSLTRPSEDDLHSPPGGRQIGGSDNLGRGRSPSIDRADGLRPRGLAPLETVAERKSEYMPGFSLNEAAQAAEGGPEPVQSSQSAAPSAETRQPLNTELPPVGSLSTFGDDFWDSAQKSGATQSAVPTATSSAQDLALANTLLPQPEVGPTPEIPLQHQPSQGFRTAVRAAFERTDDNSVPPTPVSKSNSLSVSGSGVSRSNTDSTAGISPIMSRVPSGVYPGSRKNEVDSSTPAIAEEPSTGSRPASSGTLQGVHQIARKPSPGHSRDVSDGSLPTVSTPTGRPLFKTPSPGQSPARSAVIETAKPIAAAESGELNAANPLDAANMRNFASREADLASSSSENDNGESTAFGAEELNAQTSFLEHRRKSAVESSPERGSPVSRADSPTKGRVRDLAGKFDDIVDSRRNSTQSTSSVKSNSSGNKIMDKRLSRSPSPTKDIPRERPQPARDVSFRPKLPGTWESYATTMTVSSPEKEKQEPAMVSPITEREENSQKQSPVGNMGGGLGDTDFTPTTAKHPVEHKNGVDPMKNPMGALAAAGAAMGEAFKSAMAPAHDKSEPASWEGSAASDDEKSQAEEEQKDRSAGNVYLRPLQLDRTASSVASSSGVPTPPPKDVNELGESPVEAPAPLKSSRSPSVQPESEIGTSQPNEKTTSMDSATDDLESDRLRREIMKRLSTPSLASSAAELNRSLNPQPTAHEAANAPTENRTGSVLPLEYENYWAGSGNEDAAAVSRQTTRSNNAVPEDAVRAVQPGEPERVSSVPPANATSAGDPSLMKKFSWEQTPHSSTPDLHNQKGTSTSAADGGHLAAGTHPSIAKAIAELPTTPNRSGEGLHIMNPEPESSPSPEPVELEAPAAPNQPLDADAWRAQAGDPPSSGQPLPITPNQQPSPGAAQHHPRIPLFREILALKSADERIPKYNETREQFAAMDTGLRSWVSATLATKPEHSELANLPKQPLPPVQTGSGGGSTGLVGTMRHKHGPSISHFTTGLRKSSQSAQQTPHYQQHSDPAAQAISHSTASPTAGSATPGGAGREKMQAKGKDLLKGAGVLGGKGMKEAKGLFTKGKSRFRGSGNGNEKAAQRKNPDQPPQPSSASTTTTAPAPTAPALDNPAASTASAGTPSGLPPSQNWSTSQNQSRDPPTLPPLSLSMVDESFIESTTSALQSPLAEIEAEEGKKEKKKKRFSSTFGRLRDRSKSRSRSRPTSMVIDELVATPSLPAEYSRVQTMDKGKNNVGKLNGGGMSETDFGAGAGTAASVSEVQQEDEPANKSAPGSRPLSHSFRSNNASTSALVTPAASRPASSSFVAPDEWDSVPESATAVADSSQNQLPGLTLRRTRSPAPIGGIEMPPAMKKEEGWERLGVLPSPSIEPISWLDEREKRRSFAADQRLESVLESVIRHSTPVSPVTSKSGASFGKLAGDDHEVEEDAKEKEMEGEVKNWKVDDGESGKGKASVMDGRSSKHSLAYDKASTPSLKGPSRQSVRTRGSRGSMASLLPIPLDEIARKSLDARERMMGHENERDEKFDVSPIESDGTEQHRQGKESARQQERDDENAEDGAPSRADAPDAQAGAEPPLLYPPGDQNAEHVRTASPLQEISAAATNPTDSGRFAPSQEATHLKTPDGDTTQREYQVSPVKSDFPPSSRQRQSQAQKERPFSFVPAPRSEDGRPAQDYIGMERDQQSQGPAREQDHDPQGPSGPARQFRRTSGDEERAQYVRHIMQQPVGVRHASGSRMQPQQDPRQGFKSPPPGLVEYGEHRDPRMVPRGFQSPPPGFVEYGAGQRAWRPPQHSQPGQGQLGDTDFAANQGQGGQTGFSRQDFDPRSYSAEYQLPGVGPPPDIRPSSDSRQQKRRSLLSGMSSKTTSPGPSSPQLNERINPQHVDQNNLHRTFSYQSSLDEQQVNEQAKAQQGLPQDGQEIGRGEGQKMRRKSRGLLPFKRRSSAGLASGSRDGAPVHAQPATVGAGGQPFAPSPAVPDPMPVAAQGSVKKSRNVLQRNPSSSVLPIVGEKKEKKKRTSLLGSLFGRSTSSSKARQEKEKETEEKKPKKAESKGRLQKLQNKVHISSQAQQSREAQTQAYQPVPQIPAHLAPNDPSAYEDIRGQEQDGRSGMNAEDQYQAYRSEQVLSPPPAAVAAGLANHQQQMAASQLNYGNPRAPAAYTNTAKLGSPPPQRQGGLRRQRYYQEPHRSFSHEQQSHPPPHWQPHPSAGPQRRFSEQSQPTGYPRPHPQLRQQSTGSTTYSEWSARLSPQPLAMSPQQMPARHRSSDASSVPVVSPATSRGSSRGGGGEMGYFGQQQSLQPQRQRSDPHTYLYHQRSDPYYQQQQQVQMRMSSINEAAGHGQHLPPPPHPQQQTYQHHLQQQLQHHQQQQRPYELSLPDENGSEGSLPPLAEDPEKDIEMEKNEPRWSGGYREVLPRGYVAAAAAPTSNPNPTTPPTRPIPAQGVEPRWTEVSPEEYERVHPAYRLSGGGLPPSLPKGSISPGRLQQQQDQIRQQQLQDTGPPPGYQEHELEMDPAYAKEYGPRVPPAANRSRGDIDSNADDDEEELYAEPTWRNEASGHGQARAQEYAREHASGNAGVAGAQGQHGRQRQGPDQNQSGHRDNGFVAELDAAERRPRDDDEEAPVMHGASYPGMEWTPQWDGTD